MIYIGQQRVNEMKWITLWRGTRIACKILVRKLAGKRPFGRRRKDNVERSLRETGLKVGGG